MWSAAEAARCQEVSGPPPIPALAAPDGADLNPFDSAEDGTDGAMDVLTRGPVHEGFAEQVSADPQPGIVVAKEPPQPIDEIPPEVKPEGDDISWIPGYWFWDDERKDYLWVSGVWRRAPPDRQWIPGYWQAVDGGYQWVTGYWGNRGSVEPEYVEPPPASLEIGPSSPSPSADDFWIPGSWVITDSQYRWRPGFWQSYYDDWTWVSGRYAWTPGGCVYVPGYWDYPLTRRGCLFAPVYFHTPVYLQAGYRYRPRCWIGYGSLLLHLFVRPSYNHYYFGDYYASPYRQRYFACTQYYQTHRGYSPLYTYYQHYYRHQGIDYVARVNRWHDQFTNHRDLRPAHTWAGERHRSVHSSVGLPSQYAVMGRDLHRPLAKGEVGFKPQHISSVQVQQLRHKSRELTQLSETRRHREAVLHDRLAKQPGHLDVGARDGQTRSLPGVRTGHGQLGQLGHLKDLARPGDQQTRSLPGVRTGNGRLGQSSRPKDLARPGDQQTRSLPGVRTGNGRLGQLGQPKDLPRTGDQQTRSLPGVRTGNGRLGQLGQPKDLPRPGDQQTRSLPGVRTGNGRLGQLGQPKDLPRTGDQQTRSLPGVRTGSGTLDRSKPGLGAPAGKTLQTTGRRTDPRSSPPVKSRRNGGSGNGSPRNLDRQPTIRHEVDRIVLPKGDTARSVGPGSTRSGLPKTEPVLGRRPTEPATGVTRSQTSNRAASLRDFLASQRSKPQHEVDRVAPSVSRSVAGQNVTGSRRSAPRITLPGTRSSVTTPRTTPPGTRQTPRTAPTVPRSTPAFVPPQTRAGPRRPTPNPPSAARGRFGGAAGGSSQPSFSFKPPAPSRFRSSTPSISPSPARGSSAGRAGFSRAASQPRAPARSFRRPDKPADSGRGAAQRASGHRRG